MHENLTSERGEATALALFREWIAAVERADNGGAPKSWRLSTEVRCRMAMLG
jgi:hypothetical protein